MELNAETDTPQLEKPAVIYRCKKCRRIVASQENLVQHERGKGEESFRGKKRTGDHKEWEKDPVNCSSIFLEPMKWMRTDCLSIHRNTYMSICSFVMRPDFLYLSRTVQEGYVEEKLLCMGCNARLGSFNWAGMQCGAWVDPAFQPHKSRLDEFHM